MPGGPSSAAHTFGAVLRGRDLGGIAVEEVEMPADLRVPEHCHEGAQIYFLLEGAYSETARGREHVLRPGGGWFRPPGEPHCNAVRGGGPALTLIVTVDAGRFAPFARRHREPARLASLLLDEVRSEMLGELRSGDAAARAALEGWSLVLLSRAERLLVGAPAPVPEWLLDAESFIERASAEALSLSTVADRVGVHPATLAAAFRRFRRTSVGARIREVRLRSARAALLGSQKPLKQIAAETGFFDQAHLGRSFLRRFGVSPARYRARAGGA